MARGGAVKPALGCYLCTPSSPAPPRPSLPASLLLRDRGPQVHPILPTVGPGAPAARPASRAEAAPPQVAGPGLPRQTCHPTPRKRAAPSQLLFVPPLGSTIGGPSSRPGQGGLGHRPRPGPGAPRVLRIRPAPHEALLARLLAGGHCAELEAAVRPARAAQVSARGGAGQSRRGRGGEGGGGRPGPAVREPGSRSRLGIDDDAAVRAWVLPGLRAGLRVPVPQGERALQPARFLCGGGRASGVGCAGRSASIRGPCAAFSGIRPWSCCLPPPWWAQVEAQGWEAGRRQSPGARSWFPGSLLWAPRQVRYSFRGPGLAPPSPWGKQVPSSSSLHLAATRGGSLEAHTRRPRRLHISCGRRRAPGVPGPARQGSSILGMRAVGTQPPGPGPRDSGVRTEPSLSRPPSQAPCTVLKMPVGAEAVLRLPEFRGRGRAAALAASPSPPRQFRCGHRLRPAPQTVGD